MTDHPSDKTDVTGRKPPLSRLAVNTVLRQASPVTRLAAHEAILEAMRGDGFDADGFKYRQHVEEACTSLGLGKIDGFIINLERADHALTKIHFAHDPDRLRGAKTMQGARDGGEMVAAWNRYQREGVLAEMARLFDGGTVRYVSEAARQAFNNGHGASADANRKLWSRYRQK